MMVREKGNSKIEVCKFSLLFFLFLCFSCLNNWESGKGDEIEKNENLEAGKETKEVDDTKKDDINEVINIFDDCKFDNPLIDLPWLEGLVNEAITLGENNARIYQCSYKSGIGFLIEKYVESLDYGYIFRNCKGDVLCGGGDFSDEDACSEFHIDFENKKLIWEMKENEYPNQMEEYELEMDERDFDLISLNLAKQGSCDTVLLCGTWDIVAFAYTEDGNNISNITAISKGRLSVPVAITPIKNDPSNRWQLLHSNYNWYICSILNYFIKFQLRGSTYAYAPPEEVEIMIALTNAFSFVLKDKGKELVIYFKGDENKNLLILEKNYEN